MNIRESLTNIAKNYDLAIEQLEQFLTHESTSKDKFNIQKFMDDKMEANKRFLTQVFKTPWQVLVHIEDGEPRICLSCYNLGFLLATEEVKGESFEEILIDYYEYHLQSLAKKIEKAEATKKKHSGVKTFNRKSISKTKKSGKRRKK